MIAGLVENLGAVAVQKTGSVSRKIMGGQIHIIIVTVVLNDGAGLEATINSVAEQTYDDIEYIIIDGGSSDSTLQVIEENRKAVDSWLSEDDRGIYDAMNKGVLMAAGSGYICFMNAGDTFHNKHTVAGVAARLCEKKPDILYGDAEVQYANGFMRQVHAADLRQLWKGMCFSHQAMFIKSEVMKEKLYNINNSIAADYELICSLFVNGFEFVLFDETIARVKAGGVADVKRVRSVAAQWGAARMFWPGCKTDIYYIFKLIDTMIRVGLHRILPPPLCSYLTRMKYL